MEENLKAYWVQGKGEDWGIYLHARSSGQAKGRFCKLEPSGWYGHDEFTSVRATRIKEMDGVPLTYENLTSMTRSFMVLDENGEFLDEDKKDAERYFENYCDCPICNQSKEVE